MINLKRDNPEIPDSWPFASNKDAKLWKLSCGVLSFILILAVTGLIIQSRRPPVVYVVEVSDMGQVRTVGKAEILEYQPQFETI